MARMTVGICGSIDRDTPAGLNPVITLKKPEVQALMIRVNRQPPFLEELYSSYPELEPDIQKLLELGALRRDGQRVYVNLTLVDEADRKQVYAVAEKHALRLADRIAARRNDLFEALVTHPNPQVAPEKLAFMVIGCYLLDWGALEVLEDLAVIDFLKEQPGGNYYTLWAEERAGQSLRAIYWGGHSQLAGPYLFHTFGDHHEETRRRAFPDLLYAAREVDVPHSDLVASLLSGRPSELLEDIGRVLDAIGRGGGDGEDMGTIVGVDDAFLVEALDLLQGLHYIDRAGGKWVLKIPYFSVDRPEDVELIVKAGDIVFSTMDAWVTEHLPELKDSLAGIRPLENGVPFTEVMVQAWHYIFGLTNKELARRGVIYDTYAPGSTNRGYFPGLIKGEVLQRVMARLS